MHRRVAAATVALVVTVVLMPLTGGRAGAVSSGPPPSPSYAGDFPDPAVLWDAGTQLYWAYATQAGSTNVQSMSSKDLVHWSTIADALPTLPAWAAPGHTWAPSVARFGATWVMWYTTRHAYSGRQCLSVATASAPGGPFVDNSTGPAVCQFNNGGSIDANIFVAGGRAYLLWKSDDNALGNITHLWGSTLDATGTVVGSPTLLLSQDAAWQAPAVEGPTMVAARGSYYLFYGASDWASTSAGIGYATCSGPLGPCRDRATWGPWLGSRGSALGPSGPDVFTDASGATRLAYHAWNGCVGYPSCARALWIGYLSFGFFGPALGH
ncbi:MAG TPA: glycoside hydrolase family 43 protein [Acidimicrobiales bacterium]|nr:glycoside hydrolase family 43 protein [Acidimicrobiales bacterium]